MATLRPYLLLSLLCLGLYLPGLTVIPPLDRDEARFAQATKQMLESGDVVDIRFQDEPRHKKPAGIYWLQAIAVAATGAEATDIWAYRLPSAVGAWIAVLLTYAVGRSLFGRREALLGAAFLAASLALTLEAHQAKTDAVLLATVVAAQLALARLWMRAPAELGPDRLAFWAFWIAQGLGILIKGPITPFVSAATVLALLALERRVDWLRPLRPLRGLAVAAVLVLPWAIAIWIATDGAFYVEAVGGDFGQKLVSGQESHGAPPGYYALLMPVFFWPGALFAGPALVWAWRDRRRPGVRFALAWLVPAWLVFELVPTKLPHYVLPLYPALALLTAAALIELADRAVPILRGLGGRVWAGLWTVICVVLAAAVIAAPAVVGDGLTAWSLPPALAALAAPVAVRAALRRDRPVAAAWLAVALGGATTAATLHLVLPRLSDLWLAPRLQAAIAEAAPAAPGPIAVAGLAEPSLVFLLGTDLRLGGGAAAAAALLAAQDGVVVVRESEESEFREVLNAAGAQVVPLAAIEGLNYSKGDRLTLTVYRLAP